MHDTLVKWVDADADSHSSIISGVGSRARDKRLFASPAIGADLFRAPGQEMCFQSFKKATE